MNAVLTENIDFLTDKIPRQWSLRDFSAFQPLDLFIGNGNFGIEIVTARCSAVPKRAEILSCWKQRKQDRPPPVLLVVFYANGAALCGTSGNNPIVHIESELSQAESICREALHQPNRHSAERFATQALISLQSELPGITNSGLLAMRELQYGVPSRGDWNSARESVVNVIGKRDTDILEALGFDFKQIDKLTYLLLSNQNKRAALAILLREEEVPEAGATRFSDLSPVSYALNKADEENLRWVILIHSHRIRLYSANVEDGVGRRGRTETYIECQPSLLSHEFLPYLWLIFSADALSTDGSLADILSESQRFAGDLAKRLRERIYEEVTPLLALGVVNARGTLEFTPQELALTYDMTLTILFRLLFVAYAEDRDLLPYRSNSSYKRRSLKQKALELAEFVANNKTISEGSNYWQEVASLWNAVANGNSEWGVPAYGGGLFSSDPEISQSGAALSKIVLQNSSFEAALRQLLVIKLTEEGAPGPVDFRSLGVREFGTIYEGLLESELAIADMNLTTDKEGRYKPADDNSSVIVKKGEVYLHNWSGSRKSSGSYYTKPFAVKHLLNSALNPALNDHFIRLDNLNDIDAATEFFDFRVADISMGSAHFLVAAIDYIEKGMAQYLAKRNLPGVSSKLESLRHSALHHISRGGGERDVATIENSQLLRRMIARHCIYGVDVNPLAVQLARLAIWIHTFIPGLPLSVLDHRLIHGNSLVGVATLDEVRRKFNEVSDTIFETDVEEILSKATKPLIRLANINDATLEEVSKARDAIREIRESLNDIEAICDLITAVPISEDIRISGFAWEEWENRLDEIRSLRRSVQDELSELHPTHFITAFPEVFLRKRSGFDVILGNPPWDETTVEQHAFWARYFPGLRGMLARDRESRIKELMGIRPDLYAIYNNEKARMSALRRVLSRGAFPGMGIGDPDLYKAFCWRFWQLTSKFDGYIGVVLPRNSLTAKGSSDFRKSILLESKSVKVTMLLNNLHWVFAEVHAQYLIGLVVITRGSQNDGVVSIQGPYRSLNALENRSNQPVKVSRDKLLQSNDAASLPILRSEYSATVYAQLKQSPPLDLIDHGLWRARPYRELDATNDKPLMDLDNEQCPEGFWPVYKGESFEMWNPDTGKYYAWADPVQVLESLQKKRLRSPKNSVHKEFTLGYLTDKKTLPCFAPRVAFQDVCNSIDYRTVKTCLLPPRVFVANTAPYFLWPRGDEKDQAYLLGIFSSIPLDWYARCFVTLHLNFFIINHFPIPRPYRQNSEWIRVVQLAGRLACPDERFASWANSVGVEYGPLEDDKKIDMIYELDAIVARLYGLSEKQLIHVFETYHETWDYKERLNTTLRHFHTLSSGK